MIKDPYQVLGISPGAAPEEIKRAYRQKAKEYHPDLHPNDPIAAQKMNEINEAYDMLQNPEKYRAKQEQEARRQQNSRQYGYYQQSANSQHGRYASYRYSTMISPFGFIRKIIIGIIGFRLLSMLIRLLFYGFGTGFAH